jgi:hypothetical protein
MRAFLAALLNQAVLKVRVKDFFGMTTCSTTSYLCHALPWHDHDDAPDAESAAVGTPRDWSKTDGEQTCAVNS